MKQRRKQRGVTIIEVAFASGISVMVLFAAVTTLLVGLGGWARGQGRIDAEAGSQAAVRAITSELREAMTVTVDSGGTGLTYRMPARDGSGDYVMPVTWDGITRRIELQAGDRLVITGPVNRVICRGVLRENPALAWTNPVNRIFTAGQGTITRSLTIKVISSRYQISNINARSRSRETVFLRNIPELVR